MVDEVEVANETRDHFVCLCGRERSVERPQVKLLHLIDALCVGLWEDELLRRVTHRSS